jgi:hypothetical protein
MSLPQIRRFALRTPNYECRRHVVLSITLVVPRQFPARQRHYCPIKHHQPRNALFCHHSASPTRCPANLRCRLKTALTQNTNRLQSDSGDRIAFLHHPS